jgi:hypothetical protein
MTSKPDEGGYAVAWSRRGITTVNMYQHTAADGGTARVFWLVAQAAVGGSSAPAAERGRYVARTERRNTSGHGPRGRWAIVSDREQSTQEENSTVDVRQQGRPASIKPRQL